MLDLDRLAEQEMKKPTMPHCAQNLALKIWRPSSTLD